MYSRPSDFKTVFALAMLPLFAALASASSKTVDFEETGEGQASKYERPVDAQERAEQDALYKALTKSGVDVFYGYHDAMNSGKDNSQFVTSVMNIFASGMAQYEREGDPVCAPGADESVTCTVKLKGKVVFKGEADPKFDMDIDSAKPSYCEGEKVSLSLKTTRDAYPTIISVDEDKESVLLYPNEQDKPQELKAGDAFVFPKPGFELVAILPEGKTESQELLQVIMTKKEPLFDVSDTKAKMVAGHRLLSMGDFMKTAKILSKMSREKWTMKLLPYRVVKCSPEGVK
jgi:hypothetical protein